MRFAIIGTDLQQAKDRRAVFCRQLQNLDGREFQKLREAKQRPDFATDPVDAESKRRIAHRLVAGMRLASMAAAQRGGRGAQRQNRKEGVPKICEVRAFWILPARWTFSDGPLNDPALQGFGKI